MCPETCLCASVTAGIYDLTGCPSACIQSRAGSLTDVLKSVTTVRGETAECNNTRSSTGDMLLYDFNMTNDLDHQKFFKDYSDQLKELGSLDRALETLGCNLTNRTDSICSLEEYSLEVGCNLTTYIKDYDIKPDPCVEDTASYKGSIAGLCPGACETACPKLAPPVKAGGNTPGMGAAGMPAGKGQAPQAPGMAGNETGAMAAGGNAGSAATGSSGAGSAATGGNAGGAATGSSGAGSAATGGNAGGAANGR